MKVKCRYEGCVPLIAGAVLSYVRVNNNWYLVTINLLMLPRVFCITIILPAVPRASGRVPPRAGWLLYQMYPAGTFLPKSLESVL